MPLTQRQVLETHSGLGVSLQSLRVSKDLPTQALAERVFPSTRRPGREEAASGDPLRGFPTNSGSSSKAGRRRAWEGSVGVIAIAIMPFSFHVYQRCEGLGIRS